MVLAVEMVVGAIDTYALISLGSRCHQSLNFYNVIDKNWPCGFFFSLLFFNY
jgi:hypothetical protein